MTTYSTQAHVAACLRNDRQEHLMDLNCFKACGTRGRVPDELNRSLADRIGNAAAQLLEPGPTVPGPDIRPSSPELQDGLISGINSAGRNVINIGLGDTEKVYFRTAHRDLSRKCRP